MPVVDFEKYCAMLDRATKGKFAYPAINVSNMETINAALEGFAAAKSDGFIQMSTGAGEFASGSLKKMALGAISLAEHAHRVAADYDINIAIHTDHCVPAKVDSFMIPLIEETERRLKDGKLPLYNSHMFDGSELPLDKNMETAVTLMKRLQKNNQMLEIEAGVVGGE